jgi:hypothetical protein
LAHSRSHSIAYDVGEPSAADGTSAPDGTIHGSADEGSAISIVGRDDGGDTAADCLQSGLAAVRKSVA